MKDSQIILSLRAQYPNGQTHGSFSVSVPTYGISPAVEGEIVSWTAFLAGQGTCPLVPPDESVFKKITKINLDLQRKIFDIV